MSDYRLYCFGESGNSYKAALMLALSGADWEPIRVDYFGGETRAPVFREQVSVMGEVPVLLHRGERITQSGVILDYLAEQTGRFGARDARERREIWRWLLFDNHKFTSYTATYRFLRTFVQNADAAVLAEFRQRAETAWTILNAHLEVRRYVVGERLTIADLSLCGYVFWPEEIGVDWDHYPHVAEWVARLRGETGWVHPYALMPGHPRPDSP